MAGQAPSDGVDPEPDVYAFVAELVGEFSDGVLGLRDGHPVAGVMTTEDALASISAVAWGVISRCSPKSPSAVVASSATMPIHVTITLPVTPGELFAQVLDLNLCFTGSASLLCHGTSTKMFHGSPYVLLFQGAQDLGQACARK